MTDYYSLTDEEWDLYGPTFGMAVLISRFPKDVQIIDAAQGAEQPLDPEGPIYKILNKDIRIVTGKYKTDAGGSTVQPIGEELSDRGKAGRYMDRFYRVPAGRDNTFLCQTFGRTDIDFLYREMKWPYEEKLYKGKINPAAPGLIIAREHWNTLSALGKAHHLNPVFYDNRIPDHADAILATLDQHDPKYIAGMILGWPLNPTSHEIVPESTSKIISKVSELNQQDDVHIELIFDMPYAFACAVGEDRTGKYLKTGLQHTLDHTQNVNWSVIISFSKLFSFATSGASIITVNKERAGAIAAKLGDNGLGLVGQPQITKNIAELIGGQNDEILWAHKETMRERYRLCGEFLERSSSSALGDRVVEGGKNMLRLKEIPAEKIIGHKVTCHDGRERVIRNGNDATTYLINQYHIGIASNGVSDQGMLRFRYAARVNPQREFTEVVNLSNKGLLEIANSPLETAANQNDPVPGHSENGHNGSPVITSVPEPSVHKG